ncbi:TadE/TadG family type IV pilus assembly protein [Streptomyces griseorubiginosus]|uniref:TadE/TadG family type IV pilus assembly protein n=1 Tax=Streptomyces griseorubiginosus TaxID=67304 RepID=UPI001AD77456|nr:TadE/TadG family type IV pilus assembly protein [Streptomyces griseorubiginosus]MBO4259790.1 pilus assembly protein [Streptomyces griseorubiginosus]
MPYDRTRHRPGRDRGQVAIEYLGFIPVLLLVALAGIQLGLVAYAAQQAGTAARAGARAASLRQDAVAACADAVSSRLTVRCEPSPGSGSVTVVAHVGIPKLFPGLGDYEATKTATMPLDH